MLRSLTGFIQPRAPRVFRFARASEATTAVEFALIAPAFLATLIAVFQTCIFLFAQTVLQNAANQAGRYFLTGQAQNAGCTATQIINGGCGTLAGVCPAAMFSCGNMYLVVQNYSSFASANTSSPSMYSGTTPVTTYAYDPGTPGDIMVVQLIYAWPVIGGPLGFTLANLPNGSAEMVGVSVFRVEPY
ncbi:MAG: TadE/TadG family type IV pilus assembly protein [Xanthobacteraceae bacterium]